MLDLESFFPAKDRFALAMALNNLLAAPGFDAWLEGEPLDIDAHAAHADGQAADRDLLDRAPRRRRADVLRLAAAQPDPRLDADAAGHDAACAPSLYMDEIFGYFPPVANPPSKTPLLTLLKQARAFGLGVVLATQNPVDLDYKGLANAGTWFIGRLQTERDKARVLDGLEGAAAGAGKGFDRAGDGADARRPRQRVFLMNNVHEDAPGRVPDPLGDVVPARAADARADQDADGRAARRRPRRRDRQPCRPRGRARAAAAAAHRGRRPVGGAAAAAAGRPAVLRPRPPQRAGGRHAASTSPCCSGGARLLR